MLSFYIMAFLHRFTHEYLFTARCVSLVSFIVCCASSSVIVWQLLGSTRSAVLSSFFCLGIFALTPICTSGWMIHSCWLRRSSWLALPCICEIAIALPESPLLLLYLSLQHPSNTTRLSFRSRFLFDLTILRRQSYIYDPFNATRLIQFHRLTPEAFLANLDQGYFGVIELAQHDADDTSQADRFPKSFLQAIAEHYHPVLVNPEAIFYKPNAH